MPVDNNNNTMGIDRLTQGKSDGTGVFDVLIKTVKSHLREEYDNNRIKGSDYATVYSQAIIQVMAQASQYVLTLSKVDAELDLLKAQAEQVRQDVSTSKQQEALLLAQTNHVIKQELQTVQETVNLVSQNKQIEAQTLGIKAESEIKQYQLDNILPVELANLTSTGLNIQAQTDNTTQQTANLLMQKTHAEAKHILDMQSIEVQIGKTTADTVLSAKQSLLVETQAQKEQTNITSLLASIKQTDYVTNFQLPSQVASQDAQTALTIKQQAQQAQATLNLAAQKEQIDKQTLSIITDTTLKNIQVDMETFNRDFKQAKELEMMTSDIALKEAQVTLSDKELLIKQSQVDLSNKEVQLKQSQIDLGVKELAIKSAQAAIAEKEILLKAEQLLIAKYELSTKLPAEIALLNTQNSLYNQKTITEKGQVDPSVILPDSVLAINNELLKEQAKSFLRTAQQTSMKLLIDTWTVRHNNDPEGNLENAANQLTDANIGKMVKTVANELGISLV